MERLDISLPSKRKIPRYQQNSQLLLSRAQTSQKTQPSLSALQFNYISNFKLEKLEICTWQYILSKGLQNLLNSNVIEQLKTNTREFMLTELDYIALLSVLQQEKVHLLNYPISMLLDLACFVVKLQMESDQNIVKLLHNKLKNLYPSFDEIIEKISKATIIQVNNINSIYSDFQKIMIQETNYSVKVGEIVRVCKLYNKKNFLMGKNGDCKINGDGEISDASKKGKIDGENQKFCALTPVEKQRKVSRPKTKKSVEKLYNFFNNQEFENGFYDAEEFESIE